MTGPVGPVGSPVRRTGEYQLAVSILQSLPDGCAVDIDDLARRVGAEKLTLLGWLREDVRLARLAALKLSR